MSGTASLSAAKNRRSGNEVKFNGQPKPQNPKTPQFRVYNLNCQNMSVSETETIVSYQKKLNIIFKAN